jgi:MoxR-like ATPase
MEMTMDWRDLQTKLAGTGYISDPDLAMAIAMTERLQRPILIEGEAGVGKTDVAKALTEILGTDLIRLQCYEGLDANAAVYEWNYQRQLLAIKIWEEEKLSADEKEEHVFQEKFLLKRPLLDAISRETPPVLLIDEIDRADEEFEAFLLEVLSDYQISIPEMGTVKAVSIPHVILTSNSTRELSDALRRRCLYHWLDYPSEEKEQAIVKARVPDAEAQLAGQIVRFVQALRREDLEKKPGIAETLDWARALVGIGAARIDESLDETRETMMCLLKTRADREQIAPEVFERLVAKAV